MKSQKGPFQAKRSSPGIKRVRETLQRRLWQIGKEFKKCQGLKEEVNYRTERRLRQEDTCQAWRHPCLCCGTGLPRSRVQAFKGSVLTLIHTHTEVGCGHISASLPGKKWKLILETTSKPLNTCIPPIHRTIKQLTHSWELGNN